MMQNEELTNESVKSLYSLVNQLKERAASITIENFPDPSKINFIQTEIKRSKQKIIISDLDSANIICDLSLKYWHAAFTEDQKLKAFIKAKLELKKVENWFFDINEIASEIEKIGKDGMYKVDGHNCLDEIDRYIGMKILSCIINKYMPSINKEPAFISVVRNYFQTKQRAEDENRKLAPVETYDDLEEALANTESLAKKHTGRNRTGFKIARMMFSGKCEALFFPKIFNEYITEVQDNIKNSNKLLVVFDLFELVIKDKAFLNEDEFFAINQKTNYYVTYQKRAIRNIIQLK